MDHLDVEYLNDILAEDERSASITPGTDFVNMTLTAGILPLEMRFSQINHCYRKVPIAYRTFTYVNSVVEGVIPPEKYVQAADGTDRGLRLSKWNIAEAMRSIEKFDEAGRHVDFVTARCSPKLFLSEDPYAEIKALMTEHGFKKPEKLCLEFPRTILYEDEEKVRMAILGMKLLKVRVMMTGAGEKDSPVTPLVNLPFDLVTLSPWLTQLLDSREKSLAATAFVAYLKDVGLDVIGDGVTNDEHITQLSRADCYGYCPSPAYKGRTEHGRLRMTLSDAVGQREEAE